LPGRACWVVDDVVEDELGCVVVVVVVVVVVAGGGPVDTTMLTELPGGTEVPGPGLVEMICPSANSLEGWAVTPPTTRPACWSRAPAWICVWPMSEGTMALAGPDETVSVTELPWGAFVPELGSELITKPLETVGLDR
jgi:hypothetical protein